MAFDDPTFDFATGEAVLGEEKDTGTDMHGTELALVPMPLNPSVRKCLTKISKGIATAQNGIDTFMQKRPDIAIRFQGNQIKLLELELKFLEFNADLYGRGAGVNKANNAAATQSNTQNNMNFNFGNAEGMDIVSKLLSGQRIVDCTPRGATERTASGDDS